MNRRRPNLTRAWRQWIYPSAFRVHGSGHDNGSYLALVDSLAGGTAELASGLPAQFSLDIANQVFRAKRNLETFSEHDSNSREVRMLRRAVKGMLALLEDQGVECVDPTGQPFDPGRLDFEMVGDPEIRGDVSQNTIVHCERPIVLIDGTLAQKGRGIVGRPA